MVSFARIFRLVCTTFSSSVMIGAVLSDVASGHVLATAGAQVGACVGGALFLKMLFELP